MESSTFSDDYLTKLRVMIRENAAQSLMFAEMLQEFVEDYTQRLKARMQGVDTASAEAQKFLESYERLVEMVPTHLDSPRRNEIGRAHV